MKPRNVYAMEAWNRKAGAHSKPKRPKHDETEEGLEEYEEEKNEQQKRHIIVWAS
jgi:hypothetical protein